MAMNQATRGLLENGGAHDIRELQRMLERTGVDNYTRAVCLIALGDPVDLDGLTDTELERLIDTYAGGIPGADWDENKAVEDAIRAAR